MGDIFEGAFTVTRIHWRTVLSISVVVALIVQAVATVVTGVWLHGNAGIDALNNNPHPSFDQLLRAASTSLGTSLVTALVRMLGTVVATAMLTVVVSRAVLGRTASLTDTWRDARGRLPHLLGLILLLSLIVAGVLVAGAAPGIAAIALNAPEAGAALLLLGLPAAAVVATWLSVRLSLSTPALMLEKQGILTAMRRSAKLVQGDWWRILGVQLLAWLLLVFVTSVLQVPAALVEMLMHGSGSAAIDDAAAGTSWPSLIVSGIGSVVAYTVSFPFSAGVAALLYLDRRIRRESLDLDLARASGVPGFADQPANGRTTYQD